MSSLHDRPVGVTKAQTIKQARAAHKAKGHPTLTNAELNQLRRSVQLEQRAESLKEREKKRSDAAKKKLEQEREMSRKQTALLSSQVKCDKFGHKSSQFHLGKFFGGKGSRETQSDNLQAEDPFGDDGLDDDSLLSVFMTPEENEVRVVNTCQMPPPVLRPEPAQITTRTKVMTHNSQMAPPPLSKAKTFPVQNCLEDFSMFLDELDSGTQIARELSAEDASKAGTSAQLVASSSNSGDFDLNVEDLAELESLVKKQENSLPTKPRPPPRAPQAYLKSIKNTAANGRAPCTAEVPHALGPNQVTAPKRSPTADEASDKRAMPPPAISWHQTKTPNHMVKVVLPKRPLPMPFRTASDLVHEGKPKSHPEVDSHQTIRSTSPIAAKRTAVLPAAQHATQASVAAVRDAALFQAGLTMSQFERCFEEDIQLTQAGYG